MTFRSILFDQGKTIETVTNKPEDFTFFSDLNLDQVIDTILSGKEEYDLKPFYYAYLNDGKTIVYRQEIMKDLESDVLMEVLDSFAAKMKKMREELAAIEKLFYNNQKERLFLDIVYSYCEAVAGLSKDLSPIHLKSSGLLMFSKYLKDYIQSEVFISLSGVATDIMDYLSLIEYDIHIKGLQVHVRKYESEENYSTEVENTFLKFKQGEVKDHKAKINWSSNLNQVEAQILVGVSQLYPDVFSQMHLFYKLNLNFADPAIVTFDREIQFYISYINYITPLKKIGLKFCLPQISQESKEIYNQGGFDLALASKLLSEKKSPVVNDFFLRKKERMIIVSGPNQGGKTTFAKSFGQMHYLTGLGCPVPGSKALLFHCDKILTHFEKEENIVNLRGKLHDELFRIHNILERASTNSLIIINEIFTSTTLYDQVFLSKKIMERIAELDLLGVWVTFIDELASFNEKTVSMISTVIPEDPAVRTFKIVRNPANGLAYALSIVEKYKLTYNDIIERLRL